MSEPRCACRGVDFGSYVNSVRLPDPPVAAGYEEQMINLGYERDHRYKGVSVYSRCFLAKYRRADRPAEEGAAPAHTTQPSPVRGPAAEEKDR